MTDQVYRDGRHYDRLFRDYGGDLPFLIDVFVPNCGILTCDPAGRFPMSDTYDDPDGKGRVTVTHSNIYDSTTQINHITTYTTGSSGEEIAGEVAMRMYFPQELDALLKYNGLPVEQKFSDYDGTHFGAGATKQLIICRAERA